MAWQGDNNQKTDRTWENGGGEFPPNGSLQMLLLEASLPSGSASPSAPDSRDWGVGSPVSYQL